MGSNGVRGMKTVTVSNRELLVRDGDDLIVLRVVGQSRQFSNSAIVTETGSDAIRPSSSWIGHMPVEESGHA